jgi:N-acetylneuraminic acid mutarotase
MCKGKLLGVLISFWLCLGGFGFFKSPPMLVKVTQGVNLGLARTLHTATRLQDGRILLTGGSDGADEQYALVEIFDPTNSTFTRVASLNTPRHEHTATLLQDNRVLVVGGYNAWEQWLADAEIYDPATDTWKRVPPIYSHGVQHTSTLLLDGRVLVVGGCIENGVCTERVEIFDPKTDSWTEARSLKEYRASQSAVLLDNGRVLVAGGSGPHGVPTDGDALLYNPHTDTWRATRSMPWQATQAQMVKLPDGRVLLAGGLTSSEYPTASGKAEIYDPARNIWSKAASLSQPRFAFNLVPLPHGQVLAVGGAREYDYPVNYPNSHPWTASSFVREIESYDSRTNRWAIAGEIPEPVTYAATVFLPGGTLWLTGGGAGHAVTTAWAQTWLLEPSLATGKPHSQCVRPICKK